MAITNHLSLLPFLRQFPYFSFISEDQLVKLAEQAIHHNFLPGEIIFLESDESSGLWILKKGRVKAFKLSPEGQEYILRFFGPGDTFNDLAALDNAPNLANAMAITHVEAWVIPSRAFFAALQEDHELCLALIHGLTGRMRNLVDRLEDLALRPVIARLAKFLVEQVENPASAHPAITRALIASHLATTPETVSRSLRTLENAGAIRFDRHRIMITDLSLLREQAQLDPN